jgi:hypothetical protein
MATPKPRTTPGINQPTVNKTYKNTSNSSSYFGNIGKEARDVYRTYSAAVDMSNRVGPGTDARANQLSDYVYKQIGQLGGAILGKRYDAKGNQTNKKVKK